MRVYVAAPFVNKAEAIEAGRLVEAAGHTITHKWWLVEHEDNRPVEERTDYLAYHAMLDFFGIHNADVMILLHLAKSEGKAVEQGVAIEMGIPVIAVGERGYKTAMNIFHWMPNYTWVASVEEAIKCLQT